MGFGRVCKAAVKRQTTLGITFIHPLDYTNNWGEKFIHFATGARRVQCSKRLIMQSAFYEGPWILFVKITTDSSPQSRTTTHCAYIKSWE